MFGSLRVTLRGGLEAALIIAIILAYLVRTNNWRAFKPVWLGTARLLNTVYGKRVLPI